MNTTEQAYFAELVEFHSWGIIKIDRIGLQFYGNKCLKSMGDG